MGWCGSRRGCSPTVARWRARLAAYVYLATDGVRPRAAPGRRGGRQDIIGFWHGQQRFIDGVGQETCRDFARLGWGLGAAAHVAETAWIQGLDLYAEGRSRLVAALELHAGLELGAPVPGWLCGGSVKLGLVPLPEVAHHHYAGRTGILMPQTHRLIAAHRPAGSGAFYGWETLTHGEQVSTRDGPASG